MRTILCLYRLDIRHRNTQIYDGPYRKSLRYRGHDYRAPCCVHVTICTHARQRLFGTVSTDGMHLNDAGGFVAASLRSFHSDEDGVVIDAHIVMPDHLHAIIILGTNPDGDTEGSISDVVQRFFDERLGQALERANVQGQPTIFQITNPL